jgi:hypothetical protein
MPGPQVLFPALLAATVLLLGAAVVTGLRGRVRLHLWTVGTTVVSLGLTIWSAEQLGELYDLDAAGAIKPVHLALAKIATAGYLAPLITGWMTLRDRRHKRLHFRCAMAILVLTVTAAITGTWMLLAAEPLPD